MKKRKIISKSKKGLFKSLVKTMFFVFGAITLMVSCFGNNNDESKILLDSLETDSVELKEAIDDSGISEPDSNKIEGLENDSIDGVEDDK